MSILPIIKAPDPLLRVKSHHITEIGDSEIKLLDDLMDTMYAAPGVGLSAIQVGIAKRMIVIDTSKKDVISNLKMINPEIIWKSEENQFNEEGCLSFPDQFVEVLRSKKIKVKYINESKKSKLSTFSGFEAVIIQHEIDHLDGNLLIDKVSSIKKNIILRKMKKIKKNLAK
ncbi:MAG: Peptide deformylase 2 [Alphaproteobacteria bacterium MarineAlpha2_Bin1]|nr:MAG: Peptide deformylase 2 [Alphaproteobacteria bacterium MarineAlpha2_Bin1]|tara:strand:+ start:62 stop:574 length:513 start_codon:yes stop_codon:yes gene_type:complete